MIVLVAPVEFSMRLEDYQALGGHLDHVTPLDEALAGRTGPQNDHVLAGQQELVQTADNPWPMAATRYVWAGDRQ